MTFAAFDGTIPTAGVNPSAQYATMQQNYLSTLNILAIDHIGFNASDGGYHKQVTFNINQAAPGFGSGKAVLFANNPSTSESYPFWQNSSGTFPLLGPTLATSPGYCTLPGGIILQWGSITGTPITNGQAVTFAKSFTTLFSITLGGASSSTNDKTINITTGSQSTSGFTVSTSGSSSFQTLYWMAIGV